MPESLASNVILLFFADDSVRKINLSELTSFNGAEKLKDFRMLFESGRIGAGGYYATFNNSIDIHAAYLYKSSVRLPLRKKDFINFLLHNQFQDR